MELFPHIRELGQPLTEAQLQPLRPGQSVIQFAKPLTPTELIEVARLARRHPAASLRIYGYATYENLDFLEYLADVPHLQIDIYALKDISGLQALSPSLLSLGLGAKKQRHSLRPLTRFRSLRRLSLEGHTKHFEVVSDLTTLESLALRSITLTSLQPLLPLRNLETFELRLGGTNDLTLLPDVGRLRYFEAWLVRGLADLSPIARIPTLSFLFLQALKQVRVLPSLAPLTSLRRVYLDTMKGLHDLRSVAAAPRLESLVAIAMNHLQPEAFQPFVGHPTLAEARIGLGSDRKNKEVRNLLGLPDGSLMGWEKFAAIEAATR